MSASDYGRTAVTISTGESIWRIVKAIFGMDSSGHLAGVYWQAFILNSYLFIPLGYLCLLWMICGDSTVLGSSVGRNVKEELLATYQSRRTVKKSALKSILICVTTSLLIELLQKITDLGMFDINDLLANSIGGGVGIFLVISYVWYKQHQRLRRDLRGKKS